jgi:hypothetical protein
VTCLEVSPCRSESGGGAGGGFSCRHLVFAGELAPLHRAPCPLLVFAGRIRRSLQRIPRSPTSWTALRANSPARRPSLSCRRTSRRPRILRVRSSTDRTPFLASSPARWCALSCRCTRVVSTPRGLRFSTIRTPFLTGVLSRVDARELRRHFVASVFQPAGRHFSPARWHALSCWCTRVASAPRGLWSSTRTSRKPLPASSTTRWCTLSCRQRHVATYHHASQVSNETDAAPAH